MNLNLDLHPDAEKSLSDFRLSILAPDGLTPKYATNEEFALDYLWEGLIKVAITRFPDQAFDAAAKAEKKKYDDFVEAEFLKRKTKPEAEPVVAAVKK
jgi:hypothetical protein